MSLIQDISEKYAKWAVGAIALALLGFILMDAFAGGSTFGQNTTTIGSVNRVKIDYIDFEKKVKAQEEFQQSQGFPMGEGSRQQIIESVWNQEVNQMLMNAEIEKAGLVIGKKELNDILFGKNPPGDLQQRFSDPNTGVYDAASARQFIDQIKKSRNQADRQQLNQYLINLELTRQNEKYSELLTNSIHYPKWLLEKQNTDNSQIARIAYVAIPYTTIADSLAKITDKEINDYIGRHKEEFKQTETRSIAYVMFDAAPTAADSAAVKTQVEQLKEEFINTQDAGTFIARYGSSVQFYDGFIGKSKIQIPFRDSIFALSQNEVFGPYLDGFSYVLAKMIDAKVMPDSVKAKHILIQTADLQSGTVILDDITAKRKIDSLDLAIKNGASFDQLAKTMSDDNKGPDGGSAAKGGDLGYFASGQMVKAFNDFCFEGKKGDRKVVKTEFGYHLVEITDQKNFELAYKIAYFAKPVFASQETDNNASHEANLFAGNNRDQNSFDANHEKTPKIKGTNKLVATDIKANDFNIPGLGTSRAFVKEIYKTDKGKMLQPHRVGDKYVVALVTEINEEGTQKADRARPAVEPLLRNKKKAEMIIKKLGAISSLEAVASAEGQVVQLADSIRLSGASNLVLGHENKVIGAAFNPANKNKVVAIPGQWGVYVIRIDNIGATAVENANIEEQRRVLQAQDKQRARFSSPANVLRKAAKIKDNRANFY